LFDRTRELLPPAPASLFNSPATLPESGFPYDIVRTGVALYGGNPVDDRDEPMAPVAHVSAILLQVRDIAPARRWATARPGGRRGPRCIGVLGVGYADGFRRAMVQPLSKSPAHVYIAGHFAPIVGRISMDLITIDLTDVPPETARRGARVELLGKHVTVNDVARWAGTIPYEILTGLGSRLARQYTSFQAPGSKPKKDQP
jgi:alanine racemase